MLTGAGTWILLWYVDSIHHWIIFFQFYKGFSSVLAALFFVACIEEISASVVLKVSHTEAFYDYLW